MGPVRFRGVGDLKVVSIEPVKKESYITERHKGYLIQQYLFFRCGNKVWDVVHRTGHAGNFVSIKVGWGPKGVQAWDAGGGGRAREAAAEGRGGGA